MSSTSLLLAIRQTPLMQTEWIAAIEDRRKLLSPHLRALATTPLGSFGCLKNTYRCAATERLTIPPTTELVGAFAHLSMQGIFQLQAEEAFVYGSKVVETEAGLVSQLGCKMFWGLMRENHWVVGKIFFAAETRGGFIKETCNKVEVHKTDLRDILAETKCPPWAILESLFRALQLWTERRKRLYEELECLSNQFSRDDEILNLVPEQSS